MNDDTDDMLGSRLDSALRGNLDVHEVDVAILVQGSRHRARRIRTRRIAGAATAAVLVFGVPVGYEVINPGTSGNNSSAALLPSNRAGGPTAGAPKAGAPTTVPNPVPADPTAVPDGYAFAASELPAGLVLEPSSRSVPDTLIAGLDCGAEARIRPTLGRQWVWAGSPSPADDLSISLTVTGWAKSEAAGAFTTVVNGTGSCTWDVPQKPRTPAGVNADQVWASTSESGGSLSARTLVRVGDGIVGIQVSRTKRSTAVVALADRLARLEVIRLRNGDLKIS
jgi:hypothetical protein